MENKYSMEEILNAVDELQKIKKRKNITPKEKVKTFNKSNIPKNTLQLIEEAENSKNQLRLQIPSLISLLAKL